MTNGLPTPPRKGTITLSGLAELFGGAPTPEISEIPGANASVTVTPAGIIGNLTQTINTQTPPILNTPPPSDVVTSTKNDVPVESTEEVSTPFSQLNAFQKTDIAARYPKYTGYEGFIVAKKEGGYDFTAADAAIAADLRTKESEANYKRSWASQTNENRQIAAALLQDERNRTGFVSDATRNAYFQIEHEDNLAQAVLNGESEADKTWGGTFLTTKRKDFTVSENPAEDVTFYNKVLGVKALVVDQRERFEQVDTSKKPTALQYLTRAVSEKEKIGLPQTGVQRLKSVSELIKTLPSNVPKSLPTPTPPPAPAAATPSPSDIIKNLPKPEVPAAPTGPSLFGLITGAATAPAKYIASEAKKPTSAGQVIARAGAEAGLSPILSPVSYIVNSFASLFARR